MLNITPRPFHAALDYIYGLKAIATPHVMGFADDEKATNLFYAAGAYAIASGVVTKHEGGLVKVLPFNTHLKIDVASAIFLAAAPWLFGFDENAKARNLMLAFAVVELMVVALSEPDKE